MNHGLEGKFVKNIYFNKLGLSCTQLKLKGISIKLYFRIIFDVPILGI